MYDRVILGGTVVDPSQQLHAVRDVAIQDGRIAAVEETISPDAARETIDAKGKVVTPGLVDLHVHAYWGVSEYGIEADRHCLPAGVTTVLDAGTAGHLTWPGFRRYVIEPSATRIRALLHVAGQGMPANDVGELVDFRWADVSAAVQTLKDNPDLILGMKVRLSALHTDGNAWVVLGRAREAADALELPLMVHPNKSELSIEDILSQMYDRDIFTHCYHQSETGILDEKNKVRAVVREAAERGVFFDVGHGMGSFSFRVAQAALDQGFLPHTISSDLHALNVNGPVFDLPTTMSKFLMLGMGLDEVIARTTHGPARLMGLDGEVGTLRPGACADVAILDLKEGDFEFVDAEKETRRGRAKLEPLLTIRAGKPVHPGTRPAPERAAIT